MAAAGHAADASHAAHGAGHAQPHGEAEADPVELAAGARARRAVAAAARPVAAWIALGAAGIAVGLAVRGELAWAGLVLLLAVHAAAVRSVASDLLRPEAA